MTESIATGNVVLSGVGPRVSTRGAPTDEGFTWRGSNVCVMGVSCEFSANLLFAVCTVALYSVLGSENVVMGGLSIVGEHGDCATRCHCSNSCAKDDVRTTIGARWSIRPIPSKRCCSSERPLD